MNLLPHCPHSCGFSPLCILRCVLRLDDVEKPFSQMSQTCGLSPVCVRKCLLSSEGRSKHLPQNEHGNIFLLFRRIDLTELLLLFWFEMCPDMSRIAAALVTTSSSSFGVAGGDGGEDVRSSLQVSVTLTELLPPTTVSREISVSSDEETPESLETDTRSSNVDTGEKDSVSRLPSTFGIIGCINGKDKSNGDSIGRKRFFLSNSECKTMKEAIVTTFLKNPFRNLVF